MADQEINRETMHSPIERLFEREYPSDYGVMHVPRKDSEKDVDLLYVEQQRDGLHAVRMEASYDDCMFNIGGGLHTVQDIPANYHWIALPLDEYRDGEEQYSATMEETCRERGIGVICVQPKGRGLSAKVIAAATKRSGDFIERYPDLKEKWTEVAQDEVIAEGYQVIEYY